MSGSSVTGIASAVPERMMECLWFQSAEGRAAAPDVRLGVITASVNGGQGCTARRVA